MSGAGIYLHIPFCRAKCLYCDFCSYPGYEALYAPYADALIQQIHHASAAQGDGAFDTLYVGGGTPTVLPSERLVALLAACRRALSLPQGAEATVEANPGTVTRASLQELARGGYNRLSLGVQSFHADELALLGRIHDRQAALDALADARAAGLRNISLDLMFGLPRQTLARWRANLEQALALAPEHISLYALTLEEHTPLAVQVAQGALPAPDDDLAADMYELAQELLAAAGYEQYEISNWARGAPGDRPGALPTLACRHNLHYWRNEPYLGLGAGAHGYDGLRRYAQIADPVAYVRRVAAGENTLASSEPVTRAQAMDETMMLGLRLSQGVTRAGFRQRFGVEIEAEYAEALAELAGTGLLASDAEGIRLTPRGRLLGNRVFAAFLR
jgi:oxygen-independent coproporphyrinogen-3 oxidase